MKPLIAALVIGCVLFPAVPKELWAKSRLTQKPAPSQSQDIFIDEDFPDRDHSPLDEEL